jgi:uncharacterized protein (TIGR03435 family)
MGRLPGFRMERAWCPKDRILLMVRNVFAERFGLVIHREARPMPIYALVVSRRDHPRTESSYVPVAGRDAGVALFHRPI